ncbi:MAG: hypothetical protein ABWW69_07205 [Pyrodictiaceae archaeon]
MKASHRLHRFFVFEEAVDGVKGSEAVICCEGCELVKTREAL